MAMHVGELLEKSLTEALRAVDPQTLLDIGIVGGEIYIATFAARTFYVAIGQVVGYYNPNHYHRFPCLPWRWPYKKIYLPVKKWHERSFLMKKKPTGGFSGSISVLSDLYKPGMLFIGRAYAFTFPLLQPMGAKITCHACLFAMTGAGKTTLLISQIALWKGSCFIIDPKGQITRALSRKDKRQWFIFCPEDKFGYKSACINVFDLLDALHESGDIGAFVNWAHQIALAIIPTPENIRSPYFYQTPCGFLMGLIVHVYTAHPKDEWNLPVLRDLIKFGCRVFDEKTGKEITTKDEALELLFCAMRNNPVIEGIVPGAAAAFMSASNETLANLNSTLFTETIWLDNPSIRAVLRESSFDLRNLKRRDDVVFSLVAGILAIKGPYKNLFRFIINITALCFEHFEEKKGQCLMVADELPSMGNNPIIEILLPVFRSYGITFIGISQDIQLLQQAYAKTWRSFIGNADLVIWMASNEKETKEYCAAELGKREIAEVDRATGRKNKKIVDVLSAEQVGRVLEPESGRMIVTFAGKRPRIVADGSYYKTLSITQYDPDPDHGDSFLRRITRYFFDRKIAQNDVCETNPETTETYTSPTEEFSHDEKPSNIIPFRNP